MGVGMKLRFIKDCRVVSGVHEEGKTVSYSPWDGLWQMMTEPERLQRGIFVHYFGPGDYEVFRLGEDVGIALDPIERRAAEKKLDKQIKKLIKENPGKTADELAEIVAEMLKEEIVNG
jgi:hypothetical protein